MCKQNVWMSEGSMTHLQNIVGVLKIIKVIVMWNDSL